MEIEWTAVAIRDLDSLLNYISQDSEIYAISFIEKIITAVEKLEDFPEIGRIVPEANDSNIRELLFRDFRIIYRIKDEQVQIVTIIRASRDLSNLPLKPWDVV